MNQTSRTELVLHFVLKRRHFLQLYFLLSYPILLPTWIQYNFMCFHTNITSFSFFCRISKFNILKLLSFWFSDQTGTLSGCWIVMRRGEHGPQAFQAPVDVHASADGQVFMFRRTANELTTSSDDEELSVVEMRQMKLDNHRNVQLLERKVLEDDNLSKLALQYGCKVMESRSWQPSSLSSADMSLQVLLSVNRWEI